MYDKPLYLPAGDQAMVVEFGDGIDPETNRKVRDLVLAIESSDITGIYDLMPTYRSLLVYYDPLTLSDAELRARLEEVGDGLEATPVEQPVVVNLPTLYGGEYGPDLGYVAQNSGTSEEEVVSTHSGTAYIVYMIGFNPGFPYLGGLDESLHTPRLKTPRAKIPAGSVGIAEGQTGVYPQDSPGGWQLIGRTPLRLFDSLREPPGLLAAGDYARFQPVGSEEEYLEILRQIENGEYEVVKEAAP
jgi:KipI family sensor histidine kinase inhibitor